MTATMTLHKQKPEHGDEYWSEKLAALQTSAEAKSAEAQELAQPKAYFCKDYSEVCSTIKAAFPLSINE